MGLLFLLEKFFVAAETDVAVRRSLWYARPGGVGQTASLQAPWRQGVAGQAAWVLVPWLPGGAGQAASVVWQPPCPRCARRVIEVGPPPLVGSLGLGLGLGLPIAKGVLPCVGPSPDGRSAASPPACPLPPPPRCLPPTDRTGPTRPPARPTRRKPASIVPWPRC